MAADEKNCDVGEPFVARRAESMDSEGVLHLMNKQMESVFGRLNVDDIIEKSNLSIVLAGKDSKVLAFAAFYDHPVVNGLKQSEWETWLHSICQHPKTSPINTLFLRLFVSDEEFSQDALAEILRTVFTAIPLLQYVLLPVASNINIGLSLATQFSPLPPLDNEEETPLTNIFITHRHLHYPMLHVRPAIVEDNDDLLPVLLQSSPEILTETYGKYFIAELIESQDDMHQTIVAEVNGRGIGFISVTSEVDLSVLWECYQLEPYHGLRKPCDEDEITSAVQQLLTNGTDVALQPLTSSENANVYVEKSFDLNGDQKVSEVEALQDASSVSIASTDTKSKDVVSETAEHESLPSDSTYSLPTSSAEPICKQSYSFKGPSNVISVQLFCIDEQYESRSIDLLPAIFERFPEYDFLIISQPQNILEFTLLQHFTRIPPRVDSTISHDLYVLHKCSLLDSFSVRPVTARDVKGISSFVASLDAESTVIEDVERCLAAGRDPISEEGTPLYAFIAECLDQIVGLVVLRPELELNYLRSHYNIEDYVYFSQHLPEEHMNIHHLLISPVFAPHLKHFMKESMRLSHSNNLYYPLSNMTPPKKRPYSMTLALGEMIPIKPRRQIVYPNDLSINVPGREIMEQKPLYTLYHTNRKLSMEPKVVVNARIVFIGASDVSLSALEMLVFSPHLKFNNLTLVSSCGLPSLVSNFPLPDSCCFLNEALQGVSLNAWVNVVAGTLSAINRNNNSIIVNSNKKQSVVPYDYLVITTGTQYSPEKPKTGNIPTQGVFGVKGDANDKQMFEKAKELIGNDGKIIVYGSSIATLSTLHYILDKWKIDGSRVTWVQPHTTAFPLPTPVMAEVESVLNNAGVKTYKGYVLDNYTTTCMGGETKVTGIECVDEKDKDIKIKILCEVIFCLETKCVDIQTFKAINDACIVFDHKIVIDSENSTNDNHILAAGSATKFSRFYRTEWSHTNYNSNEVGLKLAMTILSKVDPTLLPAMINSLNSGKLIPTYQQPKIIFTKLPGGRYYLVVHKPCLDNFGESKQGTELATHSENGYFRIWINEYERVQTITVLSTKSFEVSNYICLYNVHEKLLNDMLSRWKNNLITDFFLYFREQWTCAIFHDRFVDFLSEVHCLLDTPHAGETKSLIQKTRDIIDDTGHVSVEYNFKKFHGLSSYLQSAIHRKLQRYIHYNNYHLTMYAQPDTL